jgi:Flp pilus assembly protein TadG
MSQTRRRSGERGQTLIELALLVPILLIIVTAIVDFGFAFRDYIAVTNAAREGARYAVTGCTTTAQQDAIKQKVVTSSHGLLTNSDVVVDALPATASVDNCSTSAPGTGNAIKVKASHTYHFVTPLGSLVSAFGSHTITMTSSTTMRVE